jgi:hypothetical protein
MDRFMAAQRRATKTKFDRMGRIAFYYSDPAAVNPRIVRVCITDRFTKAGDQKGTSFGSAEMEIESPNIEFLIEQVQPRVNGFVSVQRGLVYQIDAILPTEDITVTGRAFRVKPDKLRNFPAPSSILISEISLNPAMLENQPPMLSVWIGDN